MGVYNPGIPRILGQEWVPIREENFQFEPDVTSQELGYGFTLASSQQLNNARFYVNEVPPGVPNSQVALVNIYPAGREALSGPIRKVIIPINSGALTGSFGGFNGGATSVADALYIQGDFKNIFAQTATSGGSLSVQFNAYFATNDYLQYLNGKRILSVNVLYSGSAEAADDTGNHGPFHKLDTDATQTTLLSFSSPQASITYGQGLVNGDLGSLGGLSNTGNRLAAIATTSNETVARLALGDAASPFLPLGNSSMGIWTFSQLRRLDLRNGLDTTMNLIFQIPVTATSTIFPNSAIFTLNYLALEVVYCEETRVAAGAQKFKYSQGLNTVQMFDINTLAANPILAAGNYTATLSFVNEGDQFFSIADITGPIAKINALRQKYSIRTLPTVEVDIPFPSYARLGETFAKTTTQVIPQLSLHASGAPLTDPHVYGRQAVGWVYGNTTVTQNLLDAGVGGSASFPWVRWYARRFGDTTVPLTLTGSSATVSGSSASVSVSDFDALPEILDGWKEITLRFNAAPNMGTGVNPTWVWSATGELAGNRWEVLGAAAPAVSGITTNPYNNPGPPSAQLGVATYGQPAAGTTIQMAWAPGIYPAVSGTTADPNSDAVLIFSQDLLPVSGFSVSTANQPLSGVALDCVAYPWYVPTSMSYNTLTWALTSGSIPATGFSYYELQRSDLLTDWQTIAQLTNPQSLGVTAIQDTFSRTVSSGWGSPDFALPGYSTWTTSGGTAADYNVAGGVGTVALPTTATHALRVGTTNITDSDQTVTVTLPQTATGSSYNSYLVARTDTVSENLYFAGVSPNTSGTVDITIARRLTGGVFSTLASVAGAFAYSPGTQVKMRFQVIGSSLRLKAWLATATEPAAWTATATDTAIQFGLPGMRIERNGSNSNVGLVLSYDNYTVLIPGFNDYEARVGISTSYRIRAVNYQSFPGPWSSTITNTLTAPGITGQGMGAGTRALLFTTNVGQNGARNLAYAMAFESDTTENFTFPEAGFTQFQFMYGRDYQTAFRPLERGGVTFQRTVLVQAAAISPPTLPDFTSLRDLAWASLPYVCVRDEDGNRWFANVNVPTGRVKMNNRELYLADLTIVEVTATPAVTVVTA